MNKFIVLTPDDADMIDTLEEAKQDALGQAESDLEAEFVVYELVPIGRARASKPIFVDEKKED